MRPAAWGRAYVDAILGLVAGLRPHNVDLRHAHDGVRVARVGVLVPSARLAHGAACAGAGGQHGRTTPGAAVHIPPCVPPPGAPRPRATQARLGGERRGGAARRGAAAGSAHAPAPEHMRGTCAPSRTTSPSLDAARDAARHGCQHPRIQQAHKGAAWGSSSHAPHWAPPARSKRVTRQPQERPPAVLRRPGTGRCRRAKPSQETQHLPKPGGRERGPVAQRSVASTATGGPARDTQARPIRNAGQRTSGLVRGVSSRPSALPAPRLQHRAPVSGARAGPPRLHSPAVTRTPGAAARGGPCAAAGGREHLTAATQAPCGIACTDPRSPPRVPGRHAPALCRAARAKKMTKPRARAFPPASQLLVQALVSHSALAGPSVTRRGEVLAARSLLSSAAEPSTAGLLAALLACRSPDRRSQSYVCTCDHFVTPVARAVQARCAPPPR